MAIKVVYFATPDIAMSSFQMLLNSHEFELLALVTQAPRPSGRGNIIKDTAISTLARKNNIDVIETEKISKDESAILKLKNYAPDFFVTFAFGQILSQEILDIARVATLNIHPSLLPKYRGANPICTALLNGDKKTGVTIAKTVLALDCGDILLQQEIDLNDKMDINDLKTKISNVAPSMLHEALLGYFEHKITPCAQDENCATYTKKNEKSEKNITFNDDCFKVHNKIRALVEDCTCQMKFGGKIIKILRSSYLKFIDCKDVAGTVLEISKKGILIKCKVGALLIERVKPEGKNAMDAYVWSLGSKIKKGDKIES